MHLFDGEGVGNMGLLRKSACVVTGRSCREHAGKLPGLCVQDVR